MSIFHRTNLYYIFSLSNRDLRKVLVIKVMIRSNFHQTPQKLSTRNRLVVSKSFLLIFLYFPLNYYLHLLFSSMQVMDKNTKETYGSNEGMSISYSFILTPSVKPKKKVFFSFTVSFI